MKIEPLEHDYNREDISYDLITLYLRDLRRTPQNASEKRLLAEIKEIEGRGGTIEVFAD
jgi:hypothetical protein